MSTISPEEMALYRATARQRAAARRQELDARFARGWQTADQAAMLLKHGYNATQVWVLGSLLHRQGFHANSDIDLAAWGIPEDRYLKAVSALLDLDPEFSIDLLRMEEAGESIHAVVMREGQEL